MRTPSSPAGRRAALIPLLLLGSSAGCATRPQGVSAAASGAASVELVVAATTDVHGWLRAWDYYADSAIAGNGLSRAATIVDSLRRTHPGRVVLLDAGDLLQGNPLTHVAARVERDTTVAHPVVAAMNAMRYDASAIGNHEYNYGVPLLDRVVRQAAFPFLSANTYRAGSAQRRYRGWTIVERAGVKVGIVGATTPGVMVWDRDNARAAGIELRDIVPAVREAVGEARAGGAQVVLVTVHSGLGEPSSYDTVSTGLPSENVSARLAREVPGIDLVVYGHSHREMADTVVGSTLLIQAKNWAASVAVAHLGLERDGDDWRVASRRGQIVRVAGRAESPAVLAATERAHRATVAYVTTPIGSTPVAWRADSARMKDTPIIDFMLEVQRRAAGADLASTAAFSLEARLDSGPISIARLQRLYPYENTLRAVRISGRQLRDYLEHSSRYYREPGPNVQPFAADPRVPGYNFDIIAGADYTLDVGRPIGSRVMRLEVRGRPVADTDSFTLALNNYRQTGGGGFAMVAGAPVVYDRGENIRDLLIEEVRRRGTIRPEDYFVQNWTLVASREFGPTATSGGQHWRPRLDAGETWLRIIGTNDFHGALEPRPDSRGVMRGGAAALAAAIGRAAAECRPTCETLLLDGGDMFQGTPASNLAFGRPVVELYNALGYAGAALGNHEWDWGRDTLRARMRQARYRIMAANVRYANGRDVEWIPDDTLVARGAIKVGVIGLATVSTPRTTRASNVAGLRFDEPAPVVDARARALRARGADVVVVTNHAGALFCDRNDDRPCAGEIIDLAAAVTERVDAFVSGHTHSFVDTTVKGTPVVQARSRGTAIDVVDLAVRRRPGAGSEVRVLGQGVRDVLTDSLPADARAAAIAQRAVAAVADRVSQPVGEVAEAMPRPYMGSQTALGNFVADAQRWAGKGDVAVMNSGGLRADLRAGPASYGTLFEIQPFANILYRVTVRGDGLRRYLERLVGTERPNAHVSGVTVTYDPSAPRGSRIIAAKLEPGGREIHDDSTYAIILNDFMVTGGDNLGLAADARSTVNLNIVDLDALIGYARSFNGPIRAPSTPRLIPTKR